MAQAAGTKTRVLLALSAMIERICEEVKVHYASSDSEGVFYRLT
jgi:hypothetical protein